MNLNPQWDPERYLTYADERGRPFVDLVTRIAAQAPEMVVDLGCGPGNLTGLLADRWPRAAVTGIDASAEMIASAQAGGAGERVRFQVGDLRDWVSAAGAAGVDVIVSNATLQWVPDHLDLLPGLVGTLRPGGWLAFQVPHNDDQPTTTIRDELAAEAPYAMFTAGASRVAAHDADTYLRALRGLGCEVDVWETTYLHVLRGPDPVFTWISGTGLRPVLQSLPGELRAKFADEIKSRLRVAYPEADGAVVMPFRRVFVVARV